MAERQRADRDDRGKPTQRGDVQTSSDSSGLSDLLEQLTRWPADGFAKLWFPGEYRILTVTWELPDDTDAILTCQSEPVYDFMTVRLAARVRSQGENRDYQPDEEERLRTTAFDLGTANGAAEARFPRALEGLETIADRIIDAVKTTFVYVARTARYELSRDSRLDSLPVFTNIRTAELLSLLRAAGFDAAAQTDAEPVTLVVNASQPFLIYLLEPQDGGFQTLLLSTVFDRAFPPSQLSALNSRLAVGAGLLTDEGRLALRFGLCVSGGTTDAAIRGRVDEFVASMKTASEFLDVPPVAPQAIM
jgi:hypothetical protein